MSQRDLYNILQFGMQSAIGYVSKGHDVLIQENIYDHPVMIGRMYKNKHKYENYYRRKLISKIRKLDYRARKLYPEEQTNYYYFQLGPQQYKNYLRQTQGKQNGEVFFGKTTFYRLLEECIISTHNKKVVFRIEMPKCFNKYKIVWWDFKADHSRFEIIMHRPKTTMRRMVVEYRNICARLHLRYKHF